MHSGFLFFNSNAELPPLLPWDDTAVVATVLFYRERQICSVLLADIQLSVIHRTAKPPVP